MFIHKHPKSIRHKFMKQQFIERHDHEERDFR